MQISDVEVTAVNRVLDHDNLELRAQMLEFINQPLFKRQFGQTVDAHRATVNRQLKGVLDQKFASVRDYKRYLGSVPPLVRRTDRAATGIRSSTSRTSRR